MGSQPVKIYIPLWCSSLLRTHVIPAVGNGECSAAVRNDMSSVSSWANPFPRGVFRKASYLPLASSTFCSGGRNVKRKLQTKAYAGRGRDKTGWRQQPRLGACIWLGTGKLENFSDPSLLWGLTGSACTMGY